MSLGFVLLVIRRVGKLLLKWILVVLMILKLVLFLVRWKFEIRMLGDCLLSWLRSFILEDVVVIWWFMFFRV